LLNNGKVLVSGGSTGTFYYSSSQIYDPATGTWEEAGDMSGGFGRYQHVSVLQNDGRVLIAGGVGPTSYLSSSQLFTPQTYDIYMQKFNASGTPAWTEDKRVNTDDGNRGTSSPNHPANYDHLSPSISIDGSSNLVVAWQEARNSVYGDDIYAQKLDSSGNKLWPDTGVGTKNTWEETGNLNTARRWLSGILLKNGKVLISGGEQDSGVPYYTSEIFDPSTSTWTTTGSLNTSRRHHLTVMLSNGRAITVGGVGGVTDDILSTSEIYDPQLGTWTITGTLLGGANYGARYLFDLVALNNGKALAIGGNNNIGTVKYLSSAQLYDPATGTWSNTGNLNTSRRNFAATVLLNGKVLVNGGRNTLTNLSSSEIYDPLTGSWQSVGNLSFGRRGHSSVLLSNGRVLTTGGTNGVITHSSAELFNPESLAWSQTGNMNKARKSLELALLNNGKVLAVGGDDGSDYYSSTELYDPSTGTWELVGNMSYSRTENRLTVLLRSGQVLSAGGYYASGVNYFPEQTEIFTPSSDIQISNDGSATNRTGVPRPEYPNNGPGWVGEQKNPVVAVDSNNDFIFAWEDDRYGVTQDWGLSTHEYQNNYGAAGGCNGGGYRSSCGAISAVLSRPLRIMGQKINAEGTAKQWGNGGSNLNNPEDLILTATGDQNTNPAIATSGTEVYVAWETNGGNNIMGSRRSNIYSQKFDSSGSSQWGGSWEETGNIHRSRDEGNVTLLNNGKVLLAGGKDGGDNSELSTCELYNPLTGSWTLTGNLNSKREAHRQVILGNGKVIVVGGDQGDPKIHLSTTEIYDPSTGTWSNSGNLTTERRAFSLSLLDNGKVIAFGGYNGSYLNSAELYDSSSGNWSAADSLNTVRGMLN